MNDKQFKTFVGVLVVVFVIAVVAFAVEKPGISTVKIKPLYDHLIEIPPNWKEAYGDTLEVRFIYNLAVLRNNQLEIAKMIARLHPPVEPIDPNQ